MNKAYFLADLHLSRASNKGACEAEKTAVEFLDSIKDDASELIMLGDILDYWYEYKHVVPKGFVRFFGKLAELSDKGIKIVWLIGNHDIWIFDYLPAELGIKVVDGTYNCKILGTAFSLQHGDAIGGKRKFRFLRKLFRNKLCQFLYSGIHPRWTVAFANAWSRHSRVSKSHMPGANDNIINTYKQYCEDEIKKGNKANYFVFGHLHTELSVQLSDNRWMIVIPDWPSTHKYGCFDGKEFKLKESQQVR